VPNLYSDTSTWARELCRIGRERHDAPFLFPTEDAALIASEQHYQDLAEVFRFPYQAPGVVDAIADKRRLYEAAKRAGIDIPRYREITTVEQAGELDGAGWLVKPSCRYVRDGDRIKTFLSTTGGPKAIGGDARSAAKRVFEAGFPTIAQEEIPGGFHDLISVGLALGRDGELLDAFTARKDCEYPEPYGDGLIVELAPDPGLIQAAVRLLHELGYWGICDVEFKRDPRDGRFKLLDANPRAWLWMTLGTIGGHSLAVQAYNAALHSGDRDPALAARAIEANPAYRRWVSARGSAGFLSRCYERRRHGLRLPMRLAMGVAATAAANLRAFKDPLYARPRAWRALTRGLRAKRG